MYKVITTALLLISTFSFAQSRHQVKSYLKGKWCHQHISGDTTNYDTYTRERYGMHPYFLFEKRSKVSLTRCTDICGCRAMVKFGKWEFENDSTIVFTFTREKLASIRKISRKQAKQRAKRMKALGVKEKIEIKKVQIISISSDTLVLNTIEERI